MGKTVGNATGNHKFKVGRTVSYTSGPYGSGRRGGVFKIMQLLPARRAPATNIE